MAAAGLTRGGLSPLRERARGPWSDARQRRRLIGITLGVGSAVTGAHWLIGQAGSRWWLAFHLAVPAVVFSLGAWSAGARRPDLQLVVRGTAIALAVALAFTLVNRQALPWGTTLSLNMLVPFFVSTFGAAAGRAPAPASASELPAEIES